MAAPGKLGSLEADLAQLQLGVRPDRRREVEAAVDPREADHVEEHHVGGVLFVDPREHVAPLGRALVAGGGGCVGDGGVEAFVADARLQAFAGILEEHREDRVAVGVVMHRLDDFRTASLGVGLGIMLQPLADFVHLQLHVEAGILEHGQQRFHGFLDVAEVADPPDQGDFGVGRDTVCRGCCQQFARLVGIVGIGRQVVVVTDGRRRCHAGGEDRAVGEDGAHEGLAVDRVVQRLAHAHVAERRGVVVDPQIERLRVRVGEVRRGIGGVLQRDVGRDVGFTGADHGRAHGTVGAEHVCRALNGRGVAPIVVADRELDEFAAGVFIERVGAGADGDVDIGVHRLAVAGDRGHAHQERQDRLGRIGVDVDGQVVDDRRGQLETAEIFRADFAGQGLGLHPGQRMGHVAGVECRPVGEGHALAQMEAPGRSVFGGIVPVKAPFN